MRPRSTIENIGALPSPFAKFLSETSFTPGRAYDNGDCFFDAFVESLRNNRLTMSDDVNLPSFKQARMLCNDYLKAPDTDKSWAKSAMDIDKANGGDDHQTCLATIQYTQPEMEDLKRQNLFGGLATWGRPAIEGRILCSALSKELGKNIQLHVIEFQEVAFTDGGDEGLSVIAHSLVDKDGLREVSNKDIDYENKEILHLLNYKSHYVPLIRPSSKAQANPHGLFSEEKSAPSSPQPTSLPPAISVPASSEEKNSSLTLFRISRQLWRDGTGARYNANIPIKKHKRLFLYGVGTIITSIPKDVIVLVDSITDNYTAWYCDDENQVKSVLIPKEERNLKLVFQGYSFPASGADPVMISERSNAELVIATIAKKCGFDPAFIGKCKKVLLYSSTATIIPDSIPSGAIVISNSPTDSHSVYHRDGENKIHRTSTPKVALESAIQGYAFPPSGPNPVIIKKPWTIAEIIAQIAFLCGHRDDVYFNLQYNQVFLCSAGTKITDYTKSHLRSAMLVLDYSAEQYAVYYWHNHETKIAFVFKNSLNPVFENYKFPSRGHAPIVIRHQDVSETIAAIAFLCGYAETRFFKKEVNNSTDLYSYSNVDDGGTAYCHIARL